MCQRQMWSWRCTWSKKMVEALDVIINDTLEVECGMDVEWKGVVEQLTTSVLF